MALLSCRTPAEGGVFIFPPVRFFDVIELEDSSL